MMSWKITSVLVVTFLFLEVLEVEGHFRKNINKTKGKKVTSGDEDIDDSKTDVGSAEDESESQTDTFARWWNGNEKENNMRKERLYKAGLEPTGRIEKGHFMDSILKAMMNNKEVQNELKELAGKEKLYQADLVPPGRIERGHFMDSILKAMINNKDVQNELEELAGKEKLYQAGLGPPGRIEKGHFMDSIIKAMINNKDVQNELEELAGKEKLYQAGLGPPGRIEKGHFMDSILKAMINNKDVQNELKELARKERTYQAGLGNTERIQKGHFMDSILKAMKNNKNVENEIIKELIKRKEKTYQAGLVGNHGKIQKDHYLDAVLEAMMYGKDVTNLLKQIAGEEKTYKAGLGNPKSIHKDPVYVCHVPKETGPCRASFTRFYYDTRDKQCKKFTYGGCRGNGNNFATAQECRKECLKQTVPTDSVHICAVPKCGSSLKQCIQITYEGCKGNGNISDIVQECRKKCIKQIVAPTQQMHPPQTRVLQTPVSGFTKENLYKAGIMEEELRDEDGKPEFQVELIGWKQGRKNGIESYREGMKHDDNNDDKDDNPMIVILTANVERTREDRDMDEEREGCRGENHHGRGHHEGDYEGHHEDNHKGKHQGHHEGGQHGRRGGHMMQDLEHLLFDYSESTGRFAIDMYKEMISDNLSNFAISPLSIHAAMSMVMLGAAGSAKRELTTSLYVQSPIHTAYKGYMESLDQGNDKNATLMLANSFYARPDFTLRHSYKNKLGRFYATHARNIDRESPEEHINNWVADKTHGKIQDFLEEGEVTGDMLMMLMNAVYFKALWEDGFNASKTSLQPFMDENGNSQDIYMMWKQGKYQVSHSDELRATAIRIPYKGNRYSFTAILPDANQKLVTVEKILTFETLNETLNSLAQENATTVELQMPKFSMDTMVDIKTQLENLGIHEVFDGSDDAFSRMSYDKNITIDKVKHRCILEVDEEGTEAEATTSVRLLAMSLPPSYKLNKPFMFLVRDDKSDMNLFMGRYANPQGDNILEDE